MQNLTIENVLERVKSQQGLKSDYMVAKVFGISQPAISNWRSGRSFPDEKMCLILAEAASIDPLFLVASMQAMRAKDDDLRAFWSGVAERHFHMH